MNYSDEILHEIKRSLINDSSFNFRQEGHMLRYGICPNCGKKELFIDLEKPFKVCCGRLNNCQWSATTRELYPDIFENISKRYPVTDTNPNASADAYMQNIRGFSLDKIKDMYRQGAILVEGRHFPAIEISITNSIIWKRFIDDDGIKANDGKKTKIWGSYKNMGWIPPNMTFEKKDTIWITEGIFKSMAFLHIGIKSIASLSAMNLPRDIIATHKGKNIKWIIALDNDEAGKTSSKKFAQELSDMGESVFVAFPAKPKEDWDDIYRAGKLTCAYLQKSIVRGFQYMAKTAIEYSFFLWAEKKQNYLVYDYKGSLYRVKVISSKLPLDEQPHYPRNGEFDLEKKFILNEFSKFRDLIEVDKICECNPKAVYTQHDRETDKRSAVFYVSFSDNRRTPRLMEVEGNVMRSAEAFNSELLKTSVYYAFTGNNLDLEILRSRWAESGQREVDVIAYAGYEHSVGIYAFPEFAYRKGVYQDINNYGYYDFDGTCIKTTMKTLQMADREKLTPLFDNFFDDFCTVFGPNGVILLAWWTGTFFAEQLRKSQASWCFMEFTGERGAGKSTLLRLLWKMTSLLNDEEGLDPNKGSDVGFFRQMAQYANLPIILLEADGAIDTRNKGFNFNRLKEFYNFGAPTRTVAAFTSGMELKKDIFRGGLLVSQNNEIAGTEDGALLSRFVSCHCTKEHFTPESRVLAEKFESLNAMDVGIYLHNVLSKEPELMSSYFANYKIMRKAFIDKNSTSEIKDDRILKCHAQVASWIKTLSLLFGHSKAFEAIQQQAIEFTVGTC